MAIGALIVLGAASLFLTTRTAHITDVMRTGPSSVSEKSIAVLPFQNLSDDKSESAYFTDPLVSRTKFFFTRLLKIAELKVISRTSTQKYT